MKTNAARTLDKLGIAYEVREHPVDPENLGAEKIAVSAGLRGAQLLLAPQDYLRATQANVGPIARCDS